MTLRAGLIVFLGLVFGVFGGPDLRAEEIAATITAVDGKTITAKTSGSKKPVPGDEASVGFTVEGVGMAPLAGTWSVTRVRGSTVTLKPTGGDAAQPSKGQQVTIQSTGRKVLVKPSAPTVAGGTKKDDKSDWLTLPVDDKSPAKERVLSRNDIRQLQRNLAALGYDAGTPDGLIGPKTRTAIRAFQRKKGMRADGRPTDWLQMMVMTAVAKAPAPPPPPKSPPPIQKPTRDSRPTAVILSEAGNYYWGKNGKPQDYDRALALNRIAARRGSPEGLYSVGVAYAFGKSVNKNLKLARQYFEKAGKQNHGRALFNLAVMYDKGMAVKEDNRRAMDYMQKAASAKLVDAYWGLANFYASGTGVPKAKETATLWYKEAARGGHKKAQDLLRKRGVAW